MMETVTTIRNAKLRHKEGRFDIRIQDGRIASAEPAGKTPAEAPYIDAAGGLVMPSTIDAHLHLDLAYSLDLTPENKSGTLLEAIGHWAEFKKTLSADNVRERAERALREVIGFGAGHIRTHVDVGTAAEMRLVEGVLAARETMRGLVDVQVVAFPQDGIIRDPGAYQQIQQAMRLGCDVIGGIAHNERTEGDSIKHIDALFELAKEFDAEIDCHIDETDDPYSRCVEVLAARTVEREWHGRVTASHVCALSSYDDVHAAKVISLMREGGVHAVTNPGVNLHLQGRFDGYPKRRGLTRVRELLAAGVGVSAGQDCIRDPFYPLGTGNMFEVGHLLIHADHMSTPQQIEQVADCITVHPAAAMRLSHYGVEPGCNADLIVLPVDTVHEAFRRRLPPKVVLKNGRVVARDGECSK